MWFSLEGLADVVVRLVEELLVQLLDPSDLGRQSSQGVPEDHQIDKLLADAPFGPRKGELVGVEVPSVLIGLLLVKVCLYDGVPSVSFAYQLLQLSVHHMKYTARTFITVTHIHAYI